MMTPSKRSSSARLVKWLPPHPLPHVENSYHTLGEYPDIGPALESSRHAPKLALSLIATSPLLPGMAGAFSSFFTTPILGPGERLKCVLQIQNNPGYTGPKYGNYKELVSGLYKEGGARSLVRGSGATLIRDGVASFFYFSTYELLKKQWTPKGEQGPSVLMTFMAGGFAGMANWAAMLPIDTVKSRFQTAPEGKYTGVLQVGKEIMAKEGIKGFYRGLTPVMVRAFPANAACFREFPRPAPSPGVVLFPHSP